MITSPEDKNGNTPIDYNRFLHDICNDQEQLAIKLIMLLIDERGPDLISKTAAAVQARDSEKIRELCHTISGTAANMCADQLSAMATELGNQARSGKTDGYDSALKNLEAAYKDVHAWGTDFIASQKQ